MKEVMANNFDLSFLTEDEYQVVLKVIQRDSELKQKDNERIRTVQKSIQDEKRKKLVTGQWFDEVKAKRYRDSLLGVDLIKASIRREIPIKSGTAGRTEQQFIHQAPLWTDSTLPQATKCENTSISIDQVTEEPPGEVDKIAAKQQIEPRSTFGQEIQRTSQNDSWESSSDESSTPQVAPGRLEKGLQRDFTGPNASSPTSESTSEWRNRQTYQTRRGSDKPADLWIRNTSNVSRIPRRINSLDSSGDFCRSGEVAVPNSNIFEQPDLHVFPDMTATLPVQENVLDIQTPKQTVAVHYKGAPSTTIPTTDDKKKKVTTSITLIPKWKNQSKENETEKSEDLPSEPVNSQGLPANEEKQIHQLVERPGISPTSQIPRIKNTLERTGGHPKACIEDLKQSSEDLPGKNRTAEMTDQRKAAFLPTFKGAKYQSSSSDDEREKSHKPGTAFTISALSNRHSEEEAVTDPNHFKNLKHFWEKEVDSNKGNNHASQVPFRKGRSPDHKNCQAELRHSTEDESKSDLLTREDILASNSSKSELCQNWSDPSSTEGEENVVEMSRNIKFAPVPAPRSKTVHKVEKTDALVTKWDKHPEENTSMVDKAFKTIDQKAHSSDDQTKDCTVPESTEYGRATTMKLSSNSSLDESMPDMKNNQNSSINIMEETVNEEVLPPKENERKEMHEQPKKLTTESAVLESAPISKPTVIQADDDICKESPIPFDSGHGQEIRTAMEDGVIHLQKECLPLAKGKEEEITVSFVPLLEPGSAQGNNDQANNFLKSQEEGKVTRSSDIDIMEPESIKNYNKHMIPRSGSEESATLCKKAHSGDSEVQASSMEELQCAVNLPPMVNRKPLALTGTYNNDDVNSTTTNSICSSQKKPSSTAVCCMDDLEINTGFKKIDSGSTYGLSPVMRALARAKKSNTKSMDNLSSTLDRETITSLVNTSETRDDNEQSAAKDQPSVMRTPVLDHARVKELSKSVPMLISESESDSASEISFNIGWHRKTPSDASHSSDMASVSSVSGSIMSVYSADFGSIDAQGSVQFALNYNEKNKVFQIYVSKCKDLAVADEKKGRTDAYVKTYLLPDKARMGKRKTSVKKRNTNPLYNEILKYKIEKSVLLIQRLNLSVWHNDTLGRNSFLGEVDLDLASWDWGNRELNWYLLKSRIPAVGDGVDHRGVINLAIKYIPIGTLGTGDPPTGEVHIWMKCARDLPQLRSSGVDSFVKCYVLPDTSKKSYQKTRIVKKDINPIYNHTIVYDGFRTEDLKEACVELTVWDHEKLTNHFLGGLRLGLGTGYSYGISVEWMDSTEEEVALWQEMMSNPNEWIPGSLALRAQLGGKKFK
ncbi:synaptotagmin-like protein 2 isoform X2 [Narcine bancroftii]|uniref:synaptotagmin-like protein 2 isoform X2 n=1 Tax=Narcine bancroftii TaxID=1343680 RepID=UPI003831FA0D